MIVVAVPYELPDVEKAVPFTELDAAEEMVVTDVTGIEAKHDNMHKGRGTRCC